MVVLVVVLLGLLLLLLILLLLLLLAMGRGQLAGGEDGESRFGGGGKIRRYRKLSTAKQKKNHLWVSGVSEEIMVGSENTRSNPKKK